MKLLKRINFFAKFYRGSKRYFFSAIGFPSKIREDVSAVYNFCRLVDDSIDEPFKSLHSFEEIVSEYKKALKTDESSYPLIHEFVRIKKSKRIEDEWVEALFKSMEMDRTNKIYEKLEDTLEYSYGVAEVIGLFMCRVLELPIEGYQTAKYLGRSAQWINFIRDINEDLEMGRTYFPISDLKKFNLKNLNYETVINQRDDFNNFMNLQFDRFEKWVKEGEKGYKFIPNKYKRPIQYATSLDKWKLGQIKMNPYIVYRKKVNPGIFELIIYLFKIYLPEKKLPRFILRENPV